MNVKEFDYDLPKELIAQYPLKEREQCRMMVVDRAAQAIEHRIFADLPSYFSARDLLVLNDTRVLPCRLIGRRNTGGRVEVFLLPGTGMANDASGFRCEAMIRPARVKTGEKIFFGEQYGIVVSRHEVSFPGMDQKEVFRLGQIPLPPYIKRDPSPDDDVYYQTVYARADGSVAAPTAGLHFTDALLGRMRDAGTEITAVTLHVGTATFKPVKCDEVADHVMGKEHFIVPTATVSALAGGRRVCSVGTTACRCLETWGATGETEGDSGIFIYPGYRFKVVSRLLTNFHLPRTTLFMLVCALGGTELLKHAYHEAVRLKYRFYSYGDVMLIL